MLCTIHSKVFVRSPVILIMGDNPMLSDLSNHLGSNTTKFCRMCMVSVSVHILDNGLTFY